MIYRWQRVPQPSPSMETYLYVTDGGEIVARVETLVSEYEYMAAVGEERRYFTTSQAARNSIEKHFKENA